MRHLGGRRITKREIGVPVDQRLAFIVIGTLRHAVADPAHADVICAVERDAVPGEGAIGVNELLETRTACLAPWNGRNRCGGWNIFVRATREPKRTLQ